MLQLLKHGIIHTADVAGLVRYGPEPTCGTAG
jgi:hypothetical protein